LGLSRSPRKPPIPFSITPAAESRLNVVCLLGAKDSREPQICATAPYEFRAIVRALTASGRERVESRIPETTYDLKITKAVDRSMRAVTPNAIDTDASTPTPKSAIIG
jgi:hypothetical protein